MKTLRLEDCDTAIHNLVILAESDEGLVLTKNGQPLYVLGLIDEFEQEVSALSRNQAFMAYLERARERAKVEGTLSLAEVRSRLGIDSAISERKSSHKLKG